MHRELFEQAIFIKVTGCSPELHSKRIPLHLFFFFLKVLQGHMAPL